MKSLPQFAIGSKIAFGTELWIVERYHKIFGSTSRDAEYEIMFRNGKTGQHRSVPIAQLDVHTRKHGI